MLVIELLYNWWLLKEPFMYDNYYLSTKSLLAISLVFTVCFELILHFFIIIEFL